MSGRPWGPRRFADEPAGGGGAGDKVKATGSELHGTLARNRKTLLVASAAGVALLALYMRNRGSSGPAASGMTVGSPATGAGAGPSTYDSSSSDIYGAFQPLVEGLQSAVDALNLGRPAATAPDSSASPGGTAAPGVPTAAAPVQAPTAPIPAPPVAPMAPIAATLTPAPGGPNDPVYQGRAVSADIVTGSRPGAILGVPAGARDLRSYDEKSQQTLLRGGSIKGGDGRTMALVPGTNYTVTR